MTGPRRPGVATVGWVLLALLAAGGGVLGGRATMRPPEVEVASDAPATVTVSEATVGRNLPMSIHAVWPRTPVGASAASGTITSVVAEDGEKVAQGDTVLTIDLRPVVVADGIVPAFRDLAAGADGRDVAQLQKLLVATGHLREGDFVAGAFRASTTAAVRAWQKETHYPVDGVVRAGDLIFTPKLPARVVLLDDAAPGMRTEPGAELFAVLGAQPRLSVVQPDGSPFVVGDELEVQVAGTWRPVVVESVGPSPDSDGAVVATMTVPGGADAICSGDCDIPTGASGTSLRGRKVVVAAATGPAVPAAALRTRPDGGTYVVDDAGAEHDVTVVSHGDGLVVLDGVAPGAVLRIPGSAPA